MRKSVRLGLAGVCAAAALAVGAAPAVAGEIGGSGKWVEVHARSECAYSGLEDDPFAPGSVQTFGQIKRMYGVPGGANSQFDPEHGGWTGCNAHMYPMR